MSELYFGDTEEQRLIVMQGEIRRMHADIYGNGKPGLLDEFRRFASTFEGAEAEREKQHKSNRARLNLIIALLAMIAGYIAIIVTVHINGRPIAAFHTNLPATYAATR